MKQLVFTCIVGLLVTCCDTRGAGGDQGNSPPALAPEVLEALREGPNPQTKLAVTALVEVLRKEAKSADKALFNKAAEALVKIGGHAALDVSKLLDDKEDTAVRQVAAKILGDIGPMAIVGGALKPLTERLQKDKDDTVRKNAAEALGKIGAASAVQPLIDALQDKAPEVRLAAAEALGKIFAWKGQGK